MRSWGIMPGKLLTEHSACRYVSMEGVVEVKGRVATEIQSADELVLTELIFSGAFKVETGQLKPAQISCRACRICPH